jgi:putative transposase
MRSGIQSDQQGLCAVLLDVFSRRVVGWAIDATQTAALVTNALGMAIEQRQPSDATVIHSDQGTQSVHVLGVHPTRHRFRSAAVDGIDRRLLRQRGHRSFWSRMQVELLDRQRWRTRVELANAIFEYLEIFHNRQRRHSALGMLTPIEFATRQSPATRHESSQSTPPNPGHPRASKFPRAIHSRSRLTSRSRSPRNYEPIRQRH